MSETGFPVTVTVQGDPSAVASEFTTKLPVAVPELTEHDGLAMSDAPFVETLGVDVTVHDASVPCSPKPTNETVVPDEPYVGVSVSCGVCTVTVKTACAESPPPLAESVIVYDPDTTAETWKVPVGAPLPTVILQAVLPTGVPEIEQELSCGKKPVPVTMTVIPGAPLAGVRVIEGPETTVNIALAKSPELPVTVTK